LITAISDFAVMESVDSNYLIGHERLFAEAAMIVLDATLTPPALETAFELAARHDVRVCVDPTSPALAVKLCPYIDHMYMVSPNAAETTALCGLADPAHDYDTAIHAARHLVSLGAKIAVVTLGEKGLAYADGSGGGHLPAISTHVIDPTGAGDAFSGTVIFGLLNEVPLDEAMRLGVTAASLTLHSPYTVLPTLSQELLYDQLAI
jgi:pseudouridine kinase